MLIASLLLLLAGCTPARVHPQTHESLHAALWTQTAAEYRANTLQAYHLAAANLDLALADPQWSAALEQQGDYAKLPPAILIDIDQTVLDNVRYNARIIREYGVHIPKKFSQWCEEATAVAIVGAKDFLNYAIERGVTVIYYSRRVESLRDCTTRNLEALGLPLQDQKYLLLNDQRPGTRKGQRRKELSARFRILLLVGDDLEDFVSGSKTDSAARRALSLEHEDRWGRQWIILPNPMYGAWETSLYEFDYTLPSAEKLDRKLQLLEQ